MNNKKKHTPKQAKTPGLGKELSNKKNFSRPAEIIPFEKLDKLLGTYKRYIGIGILLISLLIRFVYYQQTSHSPITVFHNWEQSDMYFFDHWAKEIAKGDLLSNQVLHPLLEWEKAIADAYFKSNPDEAQKYQALVGSDTTKAAWKILWNHWCGDKQFHQEPLYTYLVAATYHFFGTDVHPVFIWQLLLGAFINVLIFWLACRYFGNLTGLLAGLLAVLCGPIAMYDMVLLRSTLTVFVSLMALFTLDLALQKQKIPYYFLFGLMMGIAYLTQAYFIFFILFAIAYIIFQNRQERPLLLKSIGSFSVGLGIVLLLLAWRNSVVDAPLMSVNSNSALSFINGNSNTTDPNSGFGLNIPLTVEIMRKTNGKFLPSVLATIGSFEGMGYIGLLLRKLKTALYWYELPNNVSFYYYQQYAPVLKALFVNFFLIAPLGLVGFFVAFWKRRESLPLLAMAIVNLAPLLTVAALARYRVGLMAAMIPLAAFALVELIQYIRTSNVKNIALLGGGICLAFLFTINAGPDYVSKYQYTDFKNGYDYFYLTDIKKSIDKKDWAKSIELLDDFFRHEPTVISEFNTARKAKNKDEYILARYFAEMHTIYANVLTNSGNLQEAATQKARAEALQNAIENEQFN